MPAAPQNDIVLFNSLRDRRPRREPIPYICDFSRCRLNVRLTAYIQPLLRGHKYRVSALFESVSFAAQIRIYREACNVVSISFNSPAPICPGAEAFPTAPNVRAEPNTSPHTRLITPVAAIDIVIIGRSA